MATAKSMDKGTVLAALMEALLVSACGGPQEPSLLWRGHVEQARRAEQQGELARAESIRLQAISEMQKGKAPPAELSSTLNELGSVYFARMRFDEAAGAFLQGREAAESAQDAGQRLASSFNLGTVRAVQGNVPEARTLLEQTRSDAEQQKHQRQLAAALNNLALIAASHGDRKGAEQLLRQAEQLVEADHQPSAVQAAVLNNAANVYTRTGRRHLSADRYMKAMSVMEAVERSNHPDCGSIAHNLAELYRTEGRPDDADTLDRLARMIWERSLGGSSDALRSLDRPGQIDLYVLF